MVRSTTDGEGKLVQATIFDIIRWVDGRVRRWSLILFLAPLRFALCGAREKIGNQRRTDDADKSSNQTIQNRGALQARTLPWGGRVGKVFISFDVASCFKGFTKY